jgi:hypothetical protein
MKQDSNTLLTILAILSILTFTRSLVYLIFSADSFNLGEKAGGNIAPFVDKTLTTFAAVRFVLAAVILGVRGLHKDILTGVLAFLIFSSVQRAYYQYLIDSKSKSAALQYLETYQPLNTILVLASSVYIMTYVLF